MFEFFLVIIIISISMWIYSISRINKELAQRIDELERAFEKMLITDKKPGDTLPFSVPQSPAVTPADENIQEEPAEEVKRVFHPHEKTEPEFVPGEPLNQFWEKIEKQIVENWTGILGAVIMVIGVGFFGIYAAFKLSPFYRFIMIAAFSILLSGLFIYLKPKPKWLKLALWLRSSAGATFLFACLGAGGFEGLKWISDPFQALLLLIFGILINLYLGYAGGKQVFASLHVLLSLAALSVAPQNNTTYIIGTIVTLFGIALTYRERWDYHLLLTISSYFAYHLIWYFGIKNHNYTSIENITGIISIILVSLATVLVHYRKVYESRKFDLLPFIVHLMNWLYMGTGLIFHTTGSKWKTVYIFSASILAFFLARKARKISIRWLYVSDTLIAFFMSIIAVSTLYKWEVNTVTIIGLIFLLTLIFIVIMMVENEDLLYTIGIYVSQITGLTLIITVLSLIDYSRFDIMSGNSVMLLICSAAAAAFHIYALKSQNEEVFKPSLLAIFSGAMLLCAYISLIKFQWFEYTILLSVPYLYGRKKYQSDSLGIGAILLLLGIHIFFWNNLLHTDIPSIYEKSAHLIPIFILPVLGIIWSYSKTFNKYFSFIGIYLLSLNLLFSGYFIFSSISAYLPGVIWLLLAAVFFEAAGIISKKYPSSIILFGEPDRFILHAAYCFITAFIFRHMLMKISNNDNWGFIHLLTLNQIIAVLTFGIIYLRYFSRNISNYKSWNYLFPLLLDISQIYILIIVLYTASYFFTPISFAAIAIVYLLTGLSYKEKLSRLIFYSLLFCWLSAIIVMANTSSIDLASSPWYKQEWLADTITILLQLIFLTIFYRKNDFSIIQFPPSLKLFASISEKVNKRINNWAFYPVFFSVAIFLFNTFDKSILTFLWAAEAFLIFTLSVVLKEKYFRYCALLLIGIAICRLVFFDLSYANTITRAFVFLSVGIIMLLMNSVFNKFKDRFVQ